MGLRARKYDEGPKVERDTTITHDYGACHQERDSDCTTARLQLDRIKLSCVQNLVDDLVPED
jgi:hypothetical protein